LSLCLNVECQELRTVCYHCLKDQHNKCQKYIIDLKTIPDVIKDIYLIKKDMEVLQGRINEQFKYLFSSIE